MNIITVVHVHDASGNFLKTARTRTDLSLIVKAPFYSRNESGNWSVADPDGLDSLIDLDDVSVSIRTGLQLRKTLVEED